MAEVMAKSKAAKAAKRAAREDDDERLDALDERFSRLRKVQTQPGSGWPLC